MSKRPAVQTKVIPFRVSHDEYQQITVAIGKLGMKSQTEFMREAVSLMLSGGSHAQFIPAPRPVKKPRFVNGGEMVLSRLESGRTLSVAYLAVSTGYSEERIKQIIRDERKNGHNIISGTVSDGGRRVSFYRLEGGGV